MKIVWITAAALVVLIALVSVLVGNYFYNFALLPIDDSGSSPVVDATGTGEGTALPEGVGSAFAPNVDWQQKVGITSEHLGSRDGLRLHGYFAADPGTNRYAIICHGYHSNADSMMLFAEKFYSMGYGVLLPDARGHGQSEGAYVGMGWDERLDIADWAGWLAARSPDCEIVLYGISMGGATVMMAAGEESLPDNVRAVVEDCGYSSIKSEFRFQLEQLFHLPSFPVLNMADMMGRLRAGYSILRDGDAVAQVKKTQVPMLFIHGGEDLFVPTAMVYEVYEAATVEKGLLVVEGAGHGMASSVDRETYWQTVTDFLEKHVG